MVGQVFVQINVDVTAGNDIRICSLFIDLRSQNLPVKLAHCIIIIRRVQMRYLVGNILMAFFKACFKNLLVNKILRLDTDVPFTFLSEERFITVSCAFKAKSPAALIKEPCFTPALFWFVILVAEIVPLAPTATKPSSFRKSPMLLIVRSLVTKILPKFYNHSAQEKVAYISASDESICLVLFTHFCWWRLLSILKHKLAYKYELIQSQHKP